MSWSQLSLWAHNLFHTTYPCIVFFSKYFKACKCTTICPTNSQRRGHATVLWCHYCQLWLRAHKKTTCGWWPCRCRLYWYVEKSLLNHWPVVFIANIFNVNNFYANLFCFVKSLFFILSLFCLSTVATSTSQHDLHSNWMLRDPRRISTDVSRLKREEICLDEGAWRKAAAGTTSSMRRLQRNPIHLPKVVESALQTLRFRPKLKKKD